MSKKTQTIQTSHPHVVCIEETCDGQAIIRNTRMPISTLVYYYQSGLTIDEILDAFPFLTPAQVHDALSYYYDNPQKIDKEIALLQNEEDWIAKSPSGKLSNETRLNATTPKLAREFLQQGLETLKRKELDQQLIAGYQYLARENQQLLEEFRYVDLEGWEEEDADN